MKEPFIFDLDDTLVHTSFRYGIAIVELAKHMATYTSKDSREYERELANLEQVRKEVEEKKLSHEGLAALVEKTCSEGTKRVLRKHCERDEAVFRDADAKRGLLGKSFVKSFEDVLAHFNPAYTPDEAERVRAIGNLAFSGSVMVEGAEDVLRFLASRHHRLILMTKGDYTVQQRKIKKNRLLPWFRNHIYVVDDKNPQEFRTIFREEHINQNELGNVLSVGNSYIGDIQPAVQLGLRGIYIPVNTWAFEKTEQNPHIDVITLENILEIKTRYAEIVNR